MVMFKLPDLPYAYDALEPFIDEATMKLHHDKHHATYVEKLNAAIAGNENLEKMEIEELLSNIDKVPEDIKKAIINHGGGHFNHSFFWKIMSGNKEQEKREPQGKTKAEIEKVWGSFEKFKEEFTKEATGLFGSGWTWLAADVDGKNFHIHNHPLQENPLLHGHVPVLGLDLWEHSFYLLYKNEKAKYIENWWNVVDWEKVEENFSETK